MISLVGDVLLPFHSRAEVDLLRKTAYARFPNKNTTSFFTIIKRDSNCRRILNYDEMEQMIRSTGKTVSVVKFEGKTFDEQVNIMRNTHVLITVHGAALVNIVFMLPGGTLLEIIHPTLYAPFYKLLSLYASLQHVEFRNMTRLEACDTKTWNPYLQMNMEIDLAAFQRVLNDSRSCVCNIQQELRGMVVLFIGDTIPLNGMKYHSKIIVPLPYEILCSMIRLLFEVIMNQISSIPLICCLLQIHC